MSECYIRFRARVNLRSSRELLLLVDDKFRNSYSRIHLLISTPGGNVRDGLEIYNYIKSLPIEVYTYNIGQVDSIGIILYCVGSKRYSVPHARFLLHPMGVDVRNARFDEHLLHETQEALKVDQQNIARVVASTIGKDEDWVLENIHKRTSLDPQKAQENNIVQEIKSDIIPGGAEIFSIEELPQQQFSQQQFSQQAVELPIKLNTSIPTSNSKTLLTGI